VREILQEQHVLTEDSFAISYNTVSNRTRVVKTPGGNLRVLYIKKKGTVPKCGDCGTKLIGVSAISIESRQTGIFAAKQRQWNPQMT
jgi:ribosomal protein L34E